METDSHILYHIRTARHYLADKTSQRAHITFQNNFGAYMVGVIFGYIYHYVRPTAVKYMKVIKTLLL
jgi:hypothetical protein